MQKTTLYYRKGWHKGWQSATDNARLLLHDSGLIVQVDDNGDRLIGRPLNVDAWSADYQPSMPPGQRIDLLRALLIEARDYVDYQEKRKARHAGGKA